MNETEYIRMLENRFHSIAYAWLVAASRHSGLARREAKLLEILQFFCSTWGRESLENIKAINRRLTTVAVAMQQQRYADARKMLYMEGQGLEWSIHEAFRSADGIALLADMRSEVETRYRQAVAALGQGEVQAIQKDTPQAVAAAIVHIRGWTTEEPWRQWWSAQFATAANFIHHYTGREIEENAIRNLFEGVRFDWQHRLKDGSAQWSDLLKVFTAWTHSETGASYVDTIVTKVADRVRRIEDTARVYPMGLAATRILRALDDALTQGLRAKKIRSNTKAARAAVDNVDLTRVEALAKEQAENLLSQAQEQDKIFRKRHAERKNHEHEVRLLENIQALGIALEKSGVYVDDDLQHKVKTALTELRRWIPKEYQVPDNLKEIFSYSSSADLTQDMIKSAVREYFHPSEIWRKYKPSAYIPEFDQLMNRIQAKISRCRENASASH